MINKNSATLIIKDNDIVEFESIISLDPEHGKHFRVLRDEMGYEEMIRELIYKGYKQSIKINSEIIQLDENLSQEIPIYEENLIQINTIEELSNFLRDRGFECEVIHSISYALVASVSVDGQDIGYEVISSTNKNKVSNFTLNLFKTVTYQVNNLDYEPIINEKAGSYEIEIFNTKENLAIKNAIREIISNLKNQIINTQKYLQKGYYYNLINSFLELSTIKYLDIVKVKLLENDFIEFTKNEIFALKSKVNELLNNIPFEFSIDNDTQARAFDTKNLSFKVDTNEGVRYCHAQNQEIFDTLTNAGQNKFKISGFYTSIKSVKITKIILL